MLIFLKDANATTKGFLKAASENTVQMGFRMPLEFKLYMYMTR
jgi:hypothetical protein